ncbi:hypothetical protein A2U01_0098973, partial [Trifolium medium]|nr:hypothetical protein [Trifolium medium]
MIGKFLRNQNQGSSLGEKRIRRFLAPARKFRFAVRTPSLGEGLLAGRAG